MLTARMTNKEKRCGPEPQIWSKLQPYKGDRSLISNVDSSSFFS